MGGENHVLNAFRVRGDGLVAVGGDDETVTHLRAVAGGIHRAIHGEHHAGLQ